VNTIEFFNQYFGRHLTEQTGDAFLDAQTALSKSHPLRSGKISRLASGWAIVRPGRSSLQLEVKCSGIDVVGNGINRFEAFLADLREWSGEPRLYLTFDKRPVPVPNLFLTHDTRCVRICSPTDVETFDFTQQPSADAGDVHRILYRYIVTGGK